MSGASSRSIVGHLFAGAGVVLFAWLAFGRAFADLGHRLDSWHYMSVLALDGPVGMLELQPSRLALPWAWAAGYAVAGANPWIYHLLAFLFLLGASLCLYAMLALCFPHRPSFAFAVAVLALLWPADPTRYDASTLANRQALFLLLAGALLYLLAWRTDRRVWLLWSVVLLTLSLLTYEAHLLLLGLLPVVALAGAPRSVARWYRLLLAALVPVLIFGAVTAVTTAAGLERYRAQLWDLNGARIGQQLVDGLGVLFVQSWTEPARLLAQGVVPELRLVGAGTLLFVLWLGVLLVREPTPEREPAERPGLRLALLALVGFAVAVLGLAVFAISSIPLSEVGRTQTYAPIGGALVVCALLAAPWRRLPGQRIVTGAFCTVLVALGLTMAVTYQRNVVQGWHEQRAALDAIVQQAPNLETVTLVVITGLPDTRVVFLSGMACEAALTYRYSFEAGGLAGGGAAGAAPPGLRSINCGLLFDGRDLDPWVRVTFERDGVRYTRRQPPADLVEGLFPYRRLVMFAYDEQVGARLLDTIPAGLLPPESDAVSYNPRLIIGQR